MASSIREEKNLQEKDLAKKNQSDSAAPFIAIVVPKIDKFDPNEMQILPAYWLLPSNSPSDSSVLSSAVEKSLQEVLTESLLEDLWLAPIDDLSSWQKKWQQAGFSHWAEKHFLPAVT